MVSVVATRFLAPTVLRGELIPLSQEGIHRPDPSMVDYQFTVKEEGKQDKVYSVSVSSPSCITVEEWRNDNDYRTVLAIQVSDLVVACVNLLRQKERESVESGEIKNSDS